MSISIQIVVNVGIGRRPNCPDYLITSFQDVILNGQRRSASSSSDTNSVIRSSYDDRVIQEFRSRPAAKIELAASQVQASDNHVVPNMSGTC